MTSRVQFVDRGRLEDLPERLETLALGSGCAHVDDGWTKVFRKKKTEAWKKKMETRKKSIVEVLPDDTSKKDKFVRIRKIEQD